MSEDRIGVFLCSWGSGEEPKLDMDGLRIFASGIEGVAFAKKIDRICTKPGRRAMESAIKEVGVDRFVVAACSGRTKTPLYRSIAASSGLHPLAFEVADVRERAAYVHSLPGSQRKAETLIRMAVEKVRLFSEPPFEEEMPASRNVAVLGGGLMAASVARAMVGLGLSVDIITSEADMSFPPPYIFRGEGEVARARLAIGEAPATDGIHLHRRAKTLGFHGTPGDFGLVLEVEREVVPLRCGAVVLAPEPRMELMKLDGSPAPNADELEAQSARRIAVLPSGTSSGVGCSCITPRGVLYALSLVSKDPGIQFYLFGREVRALGETEGLQRLAQEKGVRFLRIDSEPKVEGRDPSTVIWNDALVGEMRLEADLVLLDSVLTPEVQAMSRAFEVPVDEKGELQRIDSRLSPGETVRKGVFAARYRVGNMLYDDLLLEAGSVAAKASELLSKEELEVGGAVAEVDQEKCSACLSCLRICPYSAPSIGDAGKATVRVELCQGCGSCIPLCPSRAIDIYCFSDTQMTAQSKAALRRGD